MPRKRRKTQKRRVPVNRSSVPPERVNDQAGVSMPERKPRPVAKPIRKRKKRRKVNTKVKTVERSAVAPEVTDNTYHGRRKRTRDVKPFSMREARRQAKRENRRRYRRQDDGKTADTVYKILIVVAVAAIVFFTFGVFFGVEKITAENSQYYLESEIVSASGIERGDKILFINRGRAYDNITKELPYIRSVKIRVKFPTTVVIEVTERTPAVKIVNGSLEYILSDDGVLLEATVFKNKFDLPKIICSSPVVKTEGEKLVFENEVTGATLDDVLEKIILAPLNAKVDDVNIEKVYDISFSYDGRFTIRIGDITDMDKKMQMLNEVVKRLGREASGTIDVRNPDLVRYREL